MTFRFIHTSDLHLGRKFSNIAQPEDGNTRGRLMEARHGAIGRIAAAARAHDAVHILVAGDTFDTPTPSATIVRQALAAMAEDPALHWWILPGNHDNLREAEPMWDAFERDAPPNVRCLRIPQAIDLTSNVTLLPCPVEWRSAGADPTEALLAMPHEPGKIRVGLAHGSVTDFTDAGANIPPDRDQSAHLDYLALGDWHGRVVISPRVQYCGSPEQDRFRHGCRGVCLAVRIDAPGATPGVKEIETGVFLWREIDLALSPHQDTTAALATQIAKAGRRDQLVRVKATGWATLSDQMDLRRAAAHIAPDFAFFDLKTDDLGTQYEVADLDAIDQGGALREAAELLKAEADGDTLAQEERDIAANALARLYAYVQEDAQ